ncbi:hypothetical protein AB4Y45_04430 [Paraburkholderia sp. EG287A]|uniref:hypothetical protein n=1 Tax=unclassified Paraburkholderia TaxID=2615204 RepID=UPI0034D30E05
MARQSVYMRSTIHVTSTRLLVLVDVAKKAFASDRFSSGISHMKNQLIIIPAGCLYSVSVIHEQREVSSLRLGLRQLTISDPEGLYQA